jgi:predicted ABC-type ATPase
VKQVYMVIGCPGAGKSWVCNQLRERYEYVRHDDHMTSTNAYLEAIRRASETATKPLLIETPFSVSQIKEPLEKKGFVVTPVFIIEHPDVIRERYRAREGKPIPDGHLTRQNTYWHRSQDWQAYAGTAAAVLDYLKHAAPAPERKWPWE